MKRFIRRSRRPQQRSLAIPTSTANKRSQLSKIVKDIRFIVIFYTVFALVFFEGPILYDNLTNASGKTVKEFRVQNCPAKDLQFVPFNGIDVEQVWSIQHPASVSIFNSIVRKHLPGGTKMCVILTENPFPGVTEEWVMANDQLYVTYTFSKHHILMFTPSLGDNP